tara:strand:- start:1697 stop:1873 length:177 start_codon:yes stop_codon:yes gene_type:complete
MFYVLGLSLLLLVVVCLMVFVVGGVAFFLASPRLFLQAVGDELRYLKMKIKRRSFKNG